MSQDRGRPQRFLVDTGSGADMVATTTAVIVVDAWAGVVVQRDCRWWHFRCLQDAAGSRKNNTYFLCVPN